MDPTPTSEFRLCGTFAGRESQSARKWLTQLEWELRHDRDGTGTIPPLTYLKAVDLLLVEKATVWAEKTPAITRLLNNPTPTQSTISEFKKHFLERFPTKYLDESEQPGEAEVAEVGQGAEESLKEYYRRVLNVLVMNNGRDRPRQRTLGEAPLEPLELYSLDSTLRAFIQGFKDEDVRLQTAKVMTDPERSLYAAYTMAEDVVRTRVAIAKAQAEEKSRKDFEFFQKVISRVVTHNSSLA